MGMYFYYMKKMVHKITFLKKVIDKNYLNSNSFYWDDEDLYKEAD